ncbi:MAG TPA: hypothetical protein DEB17_02260 [Chlorobaculum sp.]|uniref:Uncharacterized protein n=1 Tax=Chlorobaculum tepidum (strain ATCC 49652 / DSM 12025 / NBRC 103806 / TLS) TaxID=194439 RepID=Q8KEN3_CHLTE|nr:hypothetical protein CT0654 [Chlorobaculum tepidum TLS]HBU22820.1 hypothetical protein [Chlorobaculum sp.]
MALTELLNLFIRDGHVSILHVTHEILRRTENKNEFLFKTT